MLKRFKQAWKRDRLGVLGVSSAVAAFVLWAAPVKFVCFVTYDRDPGFVYEPACSSWGSAYTAWFESGARFSEYFEPEYWSNIGPFSDRYVAWFTSERLIAVGLLFALAVILLLLRRR
jgi:hypothetical protein